MKEIQGSKLVYIQSDEISILVTDYNELETQAWFDNKLQKIVSVSASICTAVFNDYMKEGYSSKEIPLAFFDSRAFTVPKEEVCNYFIWRQQDCTRNSINSLAQHYFSHKELHKLSTDIVQDKLFKEKGINWNDLDIWKKRGVCLYRDKIINSENQEISAIKLDWGIPIFSQDRNYIEKWI
jgi:tRNA(His) guanylyltransferase